MSAAQSRQRTYPIAYEILYGCCLTALGQMRANVERQDIERGTIVATIGGGLLGPVSELALTVAAVAPAEARLAVTWRARARGGDRTILPAFMAAVDMAARR
jgi:hypothetical protein